MSVLSHSTAEATYADIEALPPNMVGEILDGRLFASPRPAAPHALAASTLGAELNFRFQRGQGGPGGWWIIDEPELSLAVDPRYDPVVPDLAGWRLDTMPNHPDTPQYHVTPDWVCEVLSPSTTKADRLLKMPFYARAGVTHLWLVEPVNRYIEVYELKDQRWSVAATVADEETVRLTPFDAVELDLGPLWGIRRAPEPAHDSP